MRNSVLTECLIFLIVSLSTSAQTTWTGGSPVPVQQDGKPAVLAQNPVPRTASGKPDLSGMWAAPSADERVILAQRYGRNEATAMELTPWAQERYDYNRDPRGNSGREELKPERQCVPLNPSQLITGGTSSAAIEFIQSPKRLLVFYQWGHNMRQIWLDGRKQPAEPEPTWLGTSIGHWDGDSLMVDTIGLREGQWLDAGGHVHSAKLRITERYTRLDFNTMQVDVTYDDSKAFKKPYSRRMFYRLRPEWEILEDMRCWEGSPELQNQRENFQSFFRTE